MMFCLRLDNRKQVQLTDRQGNDYLRKLPIDGVRIDGGKVILTLKDVEIKPEAAVALTPENKKSKGD